MSALALLVRSRQPCLHLHTLGSRKLFPCRAYGLSNSLLGRKGHAQPQPQCKVQEIISHGQVRRGWDCCAPADCSKSSVFRSVLTVVFSLRVPQNVRKCSVFGSMESVRAHALLSRSCNLRSSPTGRSPTLNKKHRRCSAFALEDVTTLSLAFCTCQCRSYAAPGLLAPTPWPRFWYVRCVRARPHIPPSTTRAGACLHRYLF